MNYDPFNGLLDFDTPPSKIPRRWRHQEQTFQRALRQPRFLDFSDPGTGKTRAHLDVYRERLERGETEVCLVLAPKSLLEAAWATEISQFHPELTYATAYAHNREEAFDRKANIYITNIDAVKWIAAQGKRWWNKRFDRNATVLIDEISYYKHMDSARSKAVKEIADRFVYRTGLTGTPDPNSVTELWHQVLIIDDGERLGTSFYKFRGSVAHAVQTGTKAEHRTWEDNEFAEEAVGAMLADIVIRHAFEDCMDIPPNFTQAITYDLPPSLYQQYLEMELHSKLECEDGRVVGINAAARANKLLQIASGASYTDEGSGRYVLLDDSRYELVADLVAQCQHSVTFYNWIHQKIELVKRLKARGISHEILDSSVSDKRRNGIREAYQRGDFQTLLLHPQTGAHGLTLTRGTTTVFSSPFYQADFMKQAKHRIYRGGQTKRTFTQCVHAKGTIEDLVYFKVKKKTNRMNTFLRLLEENQARK